MFTAWMQPSRHWNNKSLLVAEAPAGRGPPQRSGASHYCFEGSTQTAQPRARRGRALEQHHPPSQPHSSANVRHLRPQDLADQFRKSRVIHQRNFRDQQHPLSAQPPGREERKAVPKCTFRSNPSKLLTREALSVSSMPTRASMRRSKARPSSPASASQRFRSASSSSAERSPLG